MALLTPEEIEKEVQITMQDFREAMAEASGDAKVLINAEIEQPEQPGQGGQ